MKQFSEKALQALGGFYVYGLIDPRNKKIFYIGKGCGNRVFEHEQESKKSPDSDKLKLQTIADIKDAGFEVTKILILWNLTEEEALKAEAALINVFNYISHTDLTNIASGHHSEGALAVEDFEQTKGAIELLETDIKHKIMVIKINKLYERGMDPDALYDAVRGVWRAQLKRVNTVDYVFGVYNSLIVAVYKPTKWYVCKEAKDKLPRQDIVLTPKTENRIFFIDEDYENNKLMDEYKEFYLHKSIAKLKLNQSSQNPISYFN